MEFNYLSQKREIFFRVTRGTASKDQEQLSTSVLCYTVVLDGTNSLKQFWHPCGSYQFTETGPEPVQLMLRCLWKSPGYIIIDTNLTRIHEKNAPMLSRESSGEQYIFPSHCSVFDIKSVKN